jgi:hypothetical protein
MKFLHWVTFPSLGALDQGFPVLWPVVEGLGIKVCSVRPHESMNFRVYANLTEERRVSQRAIEVSCENVLEVDRPLRVVIK